MVEASFPMMRRAIELAAQGFPAPNPRVGCVIAKNGRVIGQGYHDHAGAPHAEAAALAACNEDPAGSEVFVTLEPCNHHGRTPPCSEALIQARVASVHYAVVDPNPKASGGAERLRQSGIHVESGMLEQDARYVNRVFLKSVERARPFVVVKAAVTADGFMARPDGTSKWITGEKARAEGHRLRADLGAVLVGSRTVEVDSPLLTARIAGVVNQPVPVVIDASKRIPADHPLLARIETIRFVASQPERPNDHMLPVVNGGFRPADVLAALHERGLIGVLVEGGAHTIEQFCLADLVDEIHLFQAKIKFDEGIEGLTPEKILNNFSNFGMVASRQLGEDTHMQWARKA